MSTDHSRSAPMSLCWALIAATTVATICAATSGWTCYSYKIERDQVLEKNVQLKAQLETAFRTIDSLEDDYRELDEASTAVLRYLEDQELD